MQDQGLAWSGLLVIADYPDQKIDMCDTAWQQDSTCSWWAVLVGLFVLFAFVCWLQCHPCTLNHLGFFISHRGCVLISMQQIVAINICWAAAQLHLSKNCLHVVS